MRGQGTVDARYSFPRQRCAPRLIHCKPGYMQSRCGSNPACWCNQRLRQLTHWFKFLTTAVRTPRLVHPVPGPHAFRAPRGCRHPLVTVSHNSLVRYTDTHVDIRDDGRVSELHLDPVQDRHGFSFSLAPYRTPTRTSSSHTASTTPMRPCCCRMQKARRGGGAGSCPRSNATSSALGGSWGTCVVCKWRGDECVIRKYGRQWLAGWPAGDCGCGAADGAAGASSVTNLAYCMR